MVETAEFTELVVAVDENDKNKLGSLLEQKKALGQDVLPLLKEKRVGQIPLLHYVCKTQGQNLEMVKYLLDNGCDINALSEEGTPLQIACRSGDADLVQTLLDNGAQIISQDEIDVEKSPFYIASLMGHYEVVKTLMLHQPSMSDIIDPLELVKDESFRSCLICAGCTGGDLNIVKMWFSPGMDINHPREFVTSFDDCENNTPLYAACAGGHYDVADFLVDVGATLTKKICEQFPKIAWQILNKNGKCIEEEEDGSADENDDLPVPLHKAVFARIGLEGFHRNWLIPFTNSLVEIDLRENQIEELPVSIPWSFPLLKIFNACNNHLKVILPPDKGVYCVRLEEILLINNRLEDLCYSIFQLPKLKTLNVSNNKLQYLVKTHQQQHDWKLMRQSSDAAKAKKEWILPCLTYLNVSHNELEMLPPDIKNCSALTKLDASNNKLITFPPAWDCKMTSLDLTNNELERFPVSAEQFWCGTLKCLKLDHNKLEEINESIVKLCTLTDLCASHNNINRLPSAEVWDCKQLYLIDLSNNQLKVTAQVLESPTGGGPKLFFKRNKTLSQSEDVSSTLVFPQFLAHSLHELNLSNNGLEVVPSSICHLTSLEVLDLSKNPSIKTLPRELGRLKVCHNLILNDLHIENIRKDLLQVKDNHKRSKEIISLLRNELRQSQKYYTMKLVILGKKEKGKTTLVNLLGGKSESSHLNVGIRTSSIVISHPGKRRTAFLNLQREDSKPNFIFNTWDMAGDEAYIPTQQCFLTQNSIYFLVWDIWSLRDEIDKLGTWLYSIEARTPRSKVILVATNLDKNTTSTRNQEIQDIKTLVMERYGPDCDGFKPRCCNLELCYFAPVSCSTKEGISELKQALYEIAQKIPDPKDRQGKIMGRSIPKSYLELEKLVTSELNTLSEKTMPPFLTEQSYKDLFNKIPNNDIDDQEIVQVTKFLIESGSLLHFNDQLKGLNNLYFLDPTWLCEVLSKVLKVQSDSQLIRGGKICLSDVIDLYKNDSHYPVEYVEQYIQILERFEIALSVDNRTKLFVPSQLSKNPGMELHSYHEQGKNVRRLYQMPFIPTGLWNRFLSRIMVQVEMLTTPEWTFKINQSFAGSTIRRHSSDKSLGLHISKKDMIYWRDGMYLHHDKGYFMLESVRVPQLRERLTQSGILITVQSKDEDYSVLGMIVDQLDDLLLEHYPGLVDFDDFGQPRIQRFAVCPVCYQERNLTPLDHFTVEHCSRIMLSNENITCKKGVKVPLVELVPELFMTELPEKFQLKYGEIEIENSKVNFLGVGVTGSVYKGRYSNIDVALKFYHGVPSEQEITVLYSMDSGRDTLSIKSASEKVHEDDEEDFEDLPGQRKKINKQKSSEYTNIGSLTASFDLDEANSYKAWKAFTEMRQEVSLTSKLHHPCIVSFIGITVRPKLLMALELAPFGSLRAVLDNSLGEREPFNKYRDKDKIFDSLFSKDLTFKMVYQIAKGLEYLHKCCIVYRDLKSDNILVTSLNISSPVNVKLSDYGISKIQSSGGNLGLVGTPGYQAPEIIDGLAYDEKVDMFSFSMVVYEIISGERPYVEYKNLAQITRAIKYESKRPNLQDYNIDSKFPFLEDLMVKCWHQSACERPSASTITSISYMRSVQFLCQHKRFITPDKFAHGEIDSVADISEGKKNLLWLWEGCNEERCYHILNLSTCTYHTYRESLPGPTVTCMAKVGREVWVGTEGKEIEVYRQPCFGHPKRTNRYEKLGAIPTAIHVLHNDDQQKTCRNVLVALHDGKLQVYSPTTKESVSRNMRTRSVVSEKVQSGWYLGKTMQLTNYTMNCAAHVPCQKEMWFGCEKEIVVFNTEPLLIEGRIKLGAQFPKHRGNNIQSLVYWDERVWCLLQDTAVIIELDVHLRRATHIFNCEELHPMKMTVATYISNLPEQEYGEFEEPVFDTSVDKQSRPETLDSDELVKWADSVLPEGGSESDTDDDFETGKTEDLGQVVSSQSDRKGETLPQSAQNHTTLTPPPVPPPRRKSSENRDSDNITSMPPPVPERTRRESHLESPVFKDNVRKVQSISAIPSSENIPRETLMQKSLTLPNISLRRQCQLNKINVDSIVVVKDTLWVGRSNGDILVINVNQSNKNLYDHGEVIADLFRRNEDDLRPDVSIETLVSVGDLVVSFVKENLTKTELIAWEAYGSSEIHDIQEYWLSLRTEETRITRAKKQKAVTISEAGTF